jgi:hypothetical protein
MRIWFPLLLAPILALADQGIAYATAGWACANQNVFVLHAIHAASLAVCVAGAVVALGLWRETRLVDGDERQKVRYFLSGLGFASATFAAATIAAMWIPNWLLSACYS